MANSGYGKRGPLGWKQMAGWQRKMFHRENESRVRKGLKPLDKPKSVVSGNI
jgi:hypothetical protein